MSELWSEAGLEEDNANPVGEGTECFLGRVEVVSLHLKGRMRVSQMAQKGQEESRNREKKPQIGGGGTSSRLLDRGALMMKSLDGKSGFN